MSDKKKPILARDANNKILDPTQAKRITEELMGKLVTEQRQHEKENSFHIARGRKRDIHVNILVTIMPSVNGNTVIGEKEVPLEQIAFKLDARILPVRNATLIKAFSELCHLAKTQIMKLGMVRE